MIPHRFDERLEQQNHTTNPLFTFEHFEDPVVVPIAPPSKLDGVFAKQYSQRREHLCMALSGHTKDETLSSLYEKVRRVFESSYEQLLSYGRSYLKRISIR